LLDQNATEVYCLHNIITSALHTYAFYGELCDQAVFKAFIGNYTKKGTAEAAATGYNGITPGYIDDIFGGLRLNTAAPVSDWTPTIGGTTNPEIAYTTQYGKRVKLGKLNILIFTCTIATITGGTGNAYITGFPQVAGDTVLHNFHCQIWNYTTITPKAPNLFHNGNNMASMQICYGNPITERLAVANLANGFGISGTMFYFDN
jgi:hypothetical protein